VTADSRYSEKKRREKKRREKKRIRRDMKMSENYI
jgi:hypothetical protein